MMWAGVRNTRSMATALAALLLTLTFFGPATAQEREAPPPEGEFQLRLVEGLTLTSTGNPVEGGWAAFAQQGEGPATLATRAVRTGADGGAVLAIPEGGGTVLVWKEGYGPLALRVEAAARRRVSLQPAGALGVRVTDADSAAVPDARVEAEVHVPLIGADDPELSAHTYLVQATTDAEGRAVVPDLPDAPLSLHVAAEGFVDSYLFPVDLAEGTAQVTLGRGATVRGSVQSLPQGEPATGASVYVGERMGAVAPDGSFEVTLVPPGRHELVVRGSRIVDTAPRTIVVKEGEERTDMLLDVLASSTLRGRLRDAAGAPLDQAQLTVTWPPGAGTSPPGTATVDPRLREERVFTVLCVQDGSFAVPDLLPASGLSVLARREGYVPQLIEGVVLRPGDDSRALDFVLGQGGQLIGRVLADSGELLADAQVRAIDALPPAGREYSIGRSRPDGGFRLLGVPGGDILLEVRPARGSTARAATFGPVTARPGETIDVGDLLLPRGHTVRGNVIDAPEDAIIEVVLDGDVESEAALVQGHFVLAGLGEGRITLIVSSPTEPGEASLDVDVPSPLPVELVWQPRVLLTGRLVDSADRPVAVAELRAVPVVRSDRLTGQPAVSSALGATAAEFAVRNPAGRFEIDLESGRWHLTAWTTGGLFGVTEVETGFGGEVRIVLHEGETLRGHLFSERAGTALEGALVRALPVADDVDVGAPQGVSDESGYFEIPGVQPGVVRLRVEAAGYPPLETDPRMVQRGGSTYVGRIDVPAGHRVFGVVRDDLGSVVVGAELEFEADDDGHRMRTRTNSYGRYELSGMPAGDAVVTLVTSGGNVRSQRVVILPDDENVQLDFDLGVGVRLVGWITSRGVAAAFARVTAWSEPPRTLQVEARADAQGRFELPPVPPGNIALEVNVVGSSVPWVTDVDAPDLFEHPVRLELPEGSVSGNVVGDAYGDAVAGAFIRLYEDLGFGQTDRVVAEAVTGRDGDFLLERVPPGEYEVVATRAGFGAGTSHLIEVGPGGSLVGLQLRLPPAASVQVRILDIARNPIPGAWLRAAPAADERPTRLRRVLADVEGLARMDDLAPGAWSFSVGAPGLERLELGVEDLDQGIRELREALLQPGAALHVTVSTPDFFPVAGIGVHLLDVMDRDPRVSTRVFDRMQGLDPAYYTDRQGRLLVSGLRAGAYWLQVEGSEDPPYPVSVRDGEVVPLELVVPYELATR